MRSRRVWYLGLAALAIVIRLTPLMLGGGLESYGRYDDGVYFAASDALTFGRLPYRDFVLLHPPGILLVLAPFAALGRLTSDPIGMAAGRLAFIGIGAANTVLVARLAHRWGARAAIAAGVLYACWLPAVYSEQSTLLEPLGGTALLIALLLLVKTRSRTTGRAELLAGAALGLAGALKIWYVAPWAVIVVCLLVARRPRTALRVVAAGAVALSVVLLPFFILAPRRMYDMVVRDQLLRPMKATSRIWRLPSILGIHSFLPGHHSDVLVVTSIGLAVLAAAAITCCFDGDARFIVAVLAGNLTVLLLSPSYYTHYAALTAAPAALLVGIALDKLAATARWRPVWTTVFAVSVAGFVASGVQIARTPQGQVFPRAQFATAAGPGCVTADDPTALIEMNRLSRDFRSGCPVAIDVTGTTYDSLRRLSPTGVAVPRWANQAFQQYLYDYLLSGRSFVIIRPRNDAIPHLYVRAYEAQPTLARGDLLVLRRGGGSESG
jgi:alpha-1,2-mannosyltransferase